MKYMLFGSLSTETDQAYTKKRFNASCFFWHTQHKAPTDYTKPQQTIGSPNRLYKAPTDYTKPPKHYTKPLNIRQRPKILNKTLQY